MDKHLKSILDWWQQVGVDVPQHLPNPEKASHIPRPTSEPVSTIPTLQMRISELAAHADNLASLKVAMGSFDAEEISQAARQCVFARGNPEADIMIIGEAPGRDEDAQGLPFVGRAGQLLDKMLAAIELDAEKVYITNVINWRPENNRTPSPAHIELCKPLLYRHIEFIAPKVILLVGAVALSAMTDLSGIIKNRGQWQTLTIAKREIPALPVYHPAFLLRQPHMKKEIWWDLLMLHARLAQL